MNYQLNPCRATQFYDVHKMSQKCYEICDAYNRVYRDDPTYKRCRRMCSDTICDKRHLIRSTTRFPLPPVVWNQVPHHFPGLLAQTNCPDLAYEYCCQTCRNSRLPNECIENCRIDRLALG